eukprot:8241294-Alexandrium_andersonii.AAC.1
MRLLQRHQHRWPLQPRPGPQPNSASPLCASPSGEISSRRTTGRRPRDTPRPLPYRAYPPSAW